MTDQLEELITPVSSDRDGGFLIFRGTFFKGQEFFERTYRRLGFAHDPTDLAGKSQTSPLAN